MGASGCSGHRGQHRASGGARACTGAERGPAGLGPRVLLKMTPGSPPRPPRPSPTPEIRSLGMGSCPDLSLITPRTSRHHQHGAACPTPLSRHGNCNKYLFFPERGSAPCWAGGRKGSGPPRSRMAPGTVAVRGRKHPQDVARSSCFPSPPPAPRVYELRGQDPRPSHHGPVDAEVNVRHFLLVDAVEEGVLQRGEVLAPVPHHPCGMGRARWDRGAGRRRHRRAPAPAAPPHLCA